MSSPRLTVAGELAEADRAAGELSEDEADRAAGELSATEADRPAGEPGAEEANTGPENLAPK